MLIRHLTVTGIDIRRSLIVLCAIAGLTIAHAQSRRSIHLTRKRIDAAADAYLKPYLELRGFSGKRLNRNVVRMNGRSPGFSAEILRFIDDDVCIIVLSNNYAPTCILGSVSCHSSSQIHTIYQTFKPLIVTQWIHE